MRTRIKYYSQDYGLVTDWFTVGPNLIVRGMINPYDFQYNVITVEGNMLVSTNAHSLREAKSSIRKNLISLGVKFEDEIRFGS